MRIFSERFGDGPFTLDDVRRLIPQLPDPGELVDAMIDAGWAVSEDCHTFWLI